MKTAPIAASSTGDNTATVAAVPGKRIAVLAFVLSFGGTVNAKWKSGTGTDLTGLYYGLLGAKYEAAPGPISPGGFFIHFQTATSEGLVINLSTNVAVGGHVVYDEVQ